MHQEYHSIVVLCSLRLDSLPTRMRAVCGPYCQLSELSAGTQLIGVDGLKRLFRFDSSAVQTTRWSTSYQHIVQLHSPAGHRLTLCLPGGRSIHYHKTREGFRLLANCFILRPQCYAGLVQHLVTINFLLIFLGTRS